MTTARGTFEVGLKPISAPDEAPLGRMSIDKTFHGDLTGTSRGQMMSALTDTKGSAGYVAIEQVTGALEGRSGTFLLQHNGLMARGMGTLTINIIPDSGTGDLTGIRGTMVIAVVDKKHTYELEYAIGD
jgi:hypothetical protein